MKKSLFVAGITVFLVVLSFEARADDEDNVEETKKSDHSRQTYLKAGLVHTETCIENFSVVVNGLSIDLETYFNKNHLGLSGWSVGYRKDNLEFIDFGHLFNFSVFRTASISVVDLKVGGGVEWGIASTNYSKTRFSYNDSGLAEYEHLFLIKNSEVPFLKPSNDGTLYPFMELSLLKRNRRFLVEAGVRGNIQKFGFDRYRLDGDKLDFVSGDKTRVVPAAFVKLGIAF